MILPNYKDGSIVNLMSSIKRAFGGKHQYNELKILKTKDIKNYNNVVLLVIDGLGYNWIKKREETILKNNIKGRITSVFPATTSSAIPTFYSGVPPQQSGLTGWYMFIKEMGVIIGTLMFNLRIGGKSFKNLNIDIKDIFNFKLFPEGMKCDSYVIKNTKINFGDLTQFQKRESEIIGFKSLEGMGRQIIKVVKKNNKKKYIYAYWDKFDGTEHKFGTKSEETKKHYLEICDEIQKLVQKLKGTNTKLIITADHGFVDNTKERYIEMSNHPQLNSYLTMPLCGDPRNIYCYVKANKGKEFEKYIKTNFKNMFYLIKSEDAVKKNFFGLYKPNPKLYDRIGDYILIAKENYVIRHDMINSVKGFKHGVHSGATEDEMYVPLIVFDLK